MKKLLPVTRSARIILLLALPTVLALPALIYKEVDILNLPATVRLTKDGRRDFYVAHAMPVIPGDYLPLLNALDPYFIGKDLSYSLTVPDNLDPTFNHIISSYTAYRLTPSYKATPDTEPDMRIYFRINPKVEGAIKLCDLEGYPASYLVIGRKQR